MTAIDISRRAATAAAALAVALAAAGCAGRPFDVKVVPRVESDAISKPAVSAPLSLRAEAMWDEDWLFENLDANAVLAGVLPLRVEVENVGREPIPAKALRVEAASEDGRSLKVLDANKVRKILEGYYGITVRGRNGEDRYKADFAANGIDLKTPLAAGERRQGLLFVRLPKGETTRRRVRLAVSAKRPAARAEIAVD